MARKTTIEDLARMVQEGFGEIKEWQGQADQSFQDLSNRLDVIELELLDIKKKLDNIIYRHEFELLKDRMDDLEKKVTILKRK